MKKVEKMIEKNEMKWYSKNKRGKQWDFYRV